MTVATSEVTLNSEWSRPGAARCYPCEKMISRIEASNLVTKEIDGVSSEILEDDYFVIVEHSTIERPWGWVYFYNSKKYLETGEARYAVAGNAPLLV